MTMYEKKSSFRMLHRVVCKLIIVTLKLFSFAEYIECSVIHIQLNIYSLVIFLLWSMALFGGDASRSCNGKVVTSHFFFHALSGQVCTHLCFNTSSNCSILKRKASAFKRLPESTD